MSKVYRPDRWVIIKLSSPDIPTYYKILAGWYGGYTSGDSWRINSGITEYKIIEDYINFYGSSGSVYNCRKNLEGVSNMTGSILRQIEEQNVDGFEAKRITLEEFIAEFDNPENIHDFAH